MKKIVILLAVTFALSLVAETAFAQTWQERRQERQLERQERQQDRQERLQERRGGPADAAIIVEEGQTGDCDFACGTTTVYRRTLCGDYRPLSRDFAGDLEAPFSDCPDHEYILVRTFFARYQWKLVPVENIIAN